MQLRAQIYRPRLKVASLDEAVLKMKFYLKDQITRTQNRIEKR